MAKTTIQRQFQIVIMAQDIILTKSGKPAANTVGVLKFDANIKAEDLGNEVAVKKVIKEIWDRLIADPNFSKLWEKPQY